MPNRSDFALWGERPGIIVLSQDLTRCPLLRDYNGIIDPLPHLLDECAVRRP